MTQIDRTAPAQPVRVFSTPATTCVLTTADTNVEINVPNQAVNVSLPAFGGPYVIIDGANQAATYPITVKNSGGTTVGTINVSGSSMSFGWDGTQMAVVRQQTPVAASAAMQPVVSAASTLQALSLLGGMPTLTSIPALQAFSGTPPPAIYVYGYSNIEDGGQGFFVYAAADTTSPDNGGTTIRDGLGRRWYRDTQNMPLSARWFGAQNGNNFDNAAVFASWLNACVATGRAGHLPGNGGGAYKVASLVTVTAGAAMTNQLSIVSDDLALIQFNGATGFLKITGTGAGGRMNGCQFKGIRLQPYAAGTGYALWLQSIDRTTLSRLQILANGTLQANGIHWDNCFTGGMKDESYLDSCGVGVLIENGSNNIVVCNDDSTIVNCTTNGIYEPSAGSGNIDNVVRGYIEQNVNSVDLQNTASDHWTVDAHIDNSNTASSWDIFCAGGNSLLTGLIESSGAAFPVHMDGVNITCADMRFGGVYRGSSGAGIPAIRFHGPAQGCIATGWDMNAAAVPDISAPVGDFGTITSNPNLYYGGSPPPPSSIVQAVTSAAGTTLSASAMVGNIVNSAFGRSWPPFGVIVRTGPAAGFSDTTDTAANIIAAIPRAVVGTAFRLRYVNNSGQTATILAGAGVTVTGFSTIAAGTTKIIDGEVTGIGTPFVSLFG